MPRARFRFHGSLGDFLAAGRRDGAFDHDFRDRASVKDMFESLGVPHPEVEYVVANGHAVDFTHLVDDGDRIDVYPHDVSPEPLPALRAGVPFPDDPVFLLDVHLRRLAGYLRLIGIDTHWSAHAGDPQLASEAGTNGHVLLTRDLGLLKRSVVDHGYFVRSTAPRAQLLEVVDRFALRPHAQPFARCMRCNGAIEQVAKEDVQHLVDERSRPFYDRYARCTGCGRVYWDGAHFDRLCRLVNTVLPEWAPRQG